MVTHETDIAAYAEAQHRDARWASANLIAPVARRLTAENEAKRLETEP